MEALQHGISLCNAIASAEGVDIIPNLSHAVGMPKKSADKGSEKGDKQGGKQKSSQCLLINPPA